MFGSALEFLEEERDAWRPFEALLEVSDEALERPTDPVGPAHGWSGRDLLGHPDRAAFFRGETTEHYEEHMPELEAVLAAASG